MKLNEYCLMIPAMSKDEYSRLKDSIQKKGLLVPIVLLGDDILDGRHRYQACKELGIKPDTVQYEGNDPFGYAVSLNATRRHLNKSQRALLAANMANIKVGGIRAGQNTKASQSANLHSEVSIPKAAITLQVSERSVKTAKKLQSTAPTPVVKAVENGSISLNTAQKIVDNTEPELLAKATPAQIKSLSKTVGEKVEVRIARITQLAKQLRSEYDSLLRYEQSEIIITAFHDVHFELNLIAQIRQNQEQSK